MSPKNNGDFSVDKFSLGRKHLTQLATAIIVKYNPGIKIINKIILIMLLKSKL